MKIIRHSLITLAVLLSVTPLAAEIVVTPKEINNLGIELTIPQPVDQVSVIDATARVVLPPNGEYIVSTSQPGLLVRLHAGVGAEVVKGDALAEIRSSAFLTQQREFLDAVIDSNLATNHLARDRQLFADGIIAERRLQDTRARASAAAAKFNEHRELLRYSGLTEAAIRSLASSQRFQETLVIRAPMDGVVLDAMAVAGEHVEGMSAVYRLADLTSLCLDVQIPQEKLSAIVPGMPVNVTGLPEGVTAAITAIGQAVDSGTQTATVRAVLTDETSHLKPGQFVSVRIAADAAVESTESVWAIPTSAVIRSGSQSYVFMRSANGFERQDVALAGSDEKHSYVTRGLNADMKVAISGVAALKAHWAGQEEPGA